MCLKVGPENPQDVNSCLCKEYCDQHKFETGHVKVKCVCVCVCVCVSGLFSKLNMTISIFNFDEENMEWYIFSNLSDQVTLIDYCLNNVFWKILSQYMFASSDNISPISHPHPRPLLLCIFHIITLALPKQMPYIICYG
jgi:hypothetical protein